MTEFNDPEAVLKSKYKQLFEMINKSDVMVFFTGAGISTAAKIPDFRGDSGLDKAPLNIAQMGVSERDLDCKMPTMGHRAISLLIEKDPRFRFVTTSNHDGLHQKSGTAWEKTANIFGVAYIEECRKCKIRYIRDTITPALQRKCDNPDCHGKLKKTGVRYGQTVPVEPLQRAEESARHADLVFVLGSSMTTHPFCDLPSQSKFVICNRQSTPYDKDAELVVHDAVDSFMYKVLQHIVGEKVDLDFEYKQEFVVKQVESEVIVTTPRNNEPATFIDNIRLSLPGGSDLSFEQRLGGEFYLPVEEVSSPEVTIIVEFKEGFEVNDVLLKHKLGETTHGALVKRVTYN